MLLESLLASYFQALIFSRTSLGVFFPQRDHNSCSILASFNHAFSVHRLELKLKCIQSANQQRRGKHIAFTMHVKPRLNNKTPLPTAPPILHPISFTKSDHRIVFLPHHSSASAMGFAWIVTLRSRTSFSGRWFFSLTCSFSM